MARRLLRNPLVLLVILSAVSFAARIAFIDDPCKAPCRAGAAHTLIFDEVYYINAARVIAGIQPPAGQNYRTVPLGDDPNAEHPQLVKLVIAGAIELFGDGPFAWRIGSVLIGSLALLGMFALARACGAGRWPALGAAALLASDNILLVAGRIGTLEIYAVTAMIWSVALYLRRRPALAGLVLGVGAACKEVALYALFVLALIELGRWFSMRSGGGRALGRLAGCTAVAAGAFVGLLAVMDKIAPPYDYSGPGLLAPGPFHHLTHILSYASQQSSPHGPTGIASYPWGWFFDYKPIVYLNINPAQPSPGLEHIHPAVHFLGLVSPPILLLALPALFFAGASVLGPRWSWSWFGAVAAGASATDSDRDWALGELPLVGLAWVLGTYLPYVALSIVWERTSYLYYMIIVMPGVYLVLAALAVRARAHRWLIVGWTITIVIALVITYPLTPLP
ncbi:MAG: glycosyltransferase family 39 protein [Solirubrobacteraceae bacterium]